MQSDDTEIQDEIAPETEAEKAELEGVEDQSEIVEDSEAAEAEPEFTITIDGDDEEPETPVIRTLRKKAREEAKRRKELERKLEELQGAKPVDLGPKPTLKQFNGDERAFEAAFTDWTAQKAEVEERKRQAEAKRQAENEAWQNRLAEYTTAKTALPVKDYDDAEDVVKDVFEPQQQGIIIDAAEKPELMVYYLGKNAKQATKLAEIKNPVKFAAELARLETRMKVNKAAAKPAPEKRVTASTVATSGPDAKLEKLREAAMKSGDFTEVRRYKAKMRNA